MVELFCDLEIEITLKEKMRQVQRGDDWLVITAEDKISEYSTACVKDLVELEMKYRCEIPHKEKSFKIEREELKIIKEQEGEELEIKKGVRKRRTANENGARKRIIINKKW